MLLSILYSIIYFIIVLKLLAALTKGYCKSNKCLVGKTALITGGNTGLGFQTALNLASRGCKVIIGDFVDATNSVRTIIEKTGNSNVQYLHLDLASFASVREFVQVLTSQEQHLDILINNAGCGGLNTKTSDGIYRILQVNYLGHFLLTHLLAPLLRATKNSRVVFVSSLLAYVNDLQQGMTINRLPDNRYSVFDIGYTYGSSKAYMLAAMPIFAEKLKQDGVLVSAAHPGLVGTSIFATANRTLGKQDLASTTLNAALFLLVKLVAKTPVEGIQSILHCALASNIHNGDFIVDGYNFPKPGKLSEPLCAEIWEESVRLAGVSKEECL